MTKKTSPAYRASKEETIPINKLHPFLISPIALPQLLMWVGNLLICAASALYTYLYRL